MSRQILILAGLAVLAGCSAPSGGLHTDPRVVVRPDVSIIVPASPLVTQGAGGLTHVSVRLANTSSADVPVIVRTDWFGPDMQPVRTLLSAPIPMTVPAYGDAYVRSVAPRAEVRTFQVHVEPAP